MVPVIKILELVLGHVLDLAFLGRHELFQKASAFGMIFCLVKGNHVGKIRLFAFVTTKDIRKHGNEASGQVALALQNLVEHRGVESGAFGNIAMTKTPVSRMAFLVGIA